MSALHDPLKETPRFYSFVLTIEAPATIDADTWSEIHDAASRHDDTYGKRVGRWLGQFAQAAEDEVRETLPEGWRVTVDGA